MNCFHEILLSTSISLIELTRPLHHNIVHERLSIIYLSNNRQVVKQFIIHPDQQSGPLYRLKNYWGSQRIFIYLGYIYVCCNRTFLMRKCLKHKNTKAYIPWANRKIMPSHVTLQLENSIVHLSWETETEKAK